MKLKKGLLSLFLITCTIPFVLMMASCQSGQVPARPEGPVDIYTAAGYPCVTAHSTTRALSASYNGPLYQITRLSDGQTLDIGVVQPSVSPVPDPGGYADAAAQDAFCKDATCVISIIYDQSGNGNHLYQAPPGLFKGPAKGGFNTLAIADMAPITIGGQKAYGVYIIPGMGYRNNNAAGLAINDEPQGIYMVCDGTHYDSGCCFNYGNTSTNSYAVGRGTMDTVYFGTATAWGRGSGSGPWIMSDMEAGLFSGYDAGLNEGSPTIDSWRFVTGTVNGGGGNQWEIRGGNAQEGGLTTFYRGPRPGSNENSNYFPMHRKGAIQLGNGGDNGNGSAGTFYEGVVTTGYPPEDVSDAVQANIVAARYDVPRMIQTRITTFTPGSSQEVTAMFTNTTGAPVADVSLSVIVPEGWTSAVIGTSEPSKIFTDPVAPGASVTAMFSVTAPSATGAGYLTVKSEWTNRSTGLKHSDTSSQQIRNVHPVKINEIRFGAGFNTTDQFIELYNTSDTAVDISNWTLINTRSEWAPITLATIPSGTTVASGDYYLLGLSSSGLAAPAASGAVVINVRSTTGFKAGQQIAVDGESRTIARVGTAASAMTLIFVPASTGPWLTFPAGTENLPVTNADGFEVGQKIGIDKGGNYEEATVTAVGKASTLTNLSAPARAGDTNIKVNENADMTVGDTLTIDTGNRLERAVITNIGTPGEDGTGVVLAAPLKNDHILAVDVSDPGTGISFSPATQFPHKSGDAVQALGSGITLDRPLDRSHEYGASVVNSVVITEGYQGSTSPDQWFGDMLSPRAGSVALMDESGKAVVDAMVYGSQQSNSSGNGTIASPEIAILEGEQSQGGCIAVVPSTGRRRFGMPTTPTALPDRSIGRFPDGRDTDSNCNDFLLQSSTTLAAASSAGAVNIKVASVDGFTSGQTIIIDMGKNRETAVIATVGTPGATTVETAADKGATVVTVADAAGFSAGQTINIGSGANRETAVVASVTMGRRSFGGRPGRPATITITAPLINAHRVDAQVSGSGITLAGALSKVHNSGAQLVGNVPTPGAANRYNK